MHACMHAWNHKITAVRDHAAGTDYTLLKHSDGAGGGRRFLRLTPTNLREAVSSRHRPVITEVELQTCHNGGQVAKVGTALE